MVCVLFDGLHPHTADTRALICEACPWCTVTPPPPGVVPEHVLRLLAGRVVLEKVKWESGDMRETGKLELGWHQTISSFSLRLTHTHAYTHPHTRTLNLS